MDVWEVKYKLADKFSEYDIDEHLIDKLIKTCMDTYGFSAYEAYNNIRFMLALEFGADEYFSADDIVSMFGDPLEGVDDEDFDICIDELNQYLDIDDGFECYGDCDDCPYTDECEEGAEIFLHNAEMAIKRKNGNISPGDYDYKKCCLDNDEDCGLLYFPKGIDY